MKPKWERLGEEARRKRFWRYPVCVAFRDGTVALIWGGPETEVQGVREKSG